MKKFFIILVLAFTILEAYSQNCPSRFEILPVHVTGKSHKYRLNLALNNNSENLNGFIFEVSKPSSARWAVIDKDQNTYFMADGYGKNILANWEDHTDEEREQELYQHCFIQSRAQDNNLLAAEILNTPECRFFPCGERIIVGEFAIDMSDCDDGEYSLWTTTNCSFSYIDSPEGDGAMPGEVFSFYLYKQGDLVSIVPWFPLDDFDGIEDVIKPKTIASVKYYNLAGVESAEPQPGVSIKVTTYSDGSRQSEKIVR